METPKACDQGETTFAYALSALERNETAGAEVHIGTCAQCRHELESLGPLIGAFVSWPIDILHPAAPLHDRLPALTAEERGKLSAQWQWREPEWEEVAAGIQVKLMAADSSRSRVSMLIRLARGASYRPHFRSGGEELHLLDGELWIDGRKLMPGDYSHGPPGTFERRVWSETGCTCVLITSANDILG